MGFSVLLFLSKSIQQVVVGISVYHTHTLLIIPLSARGNLGISTHSYGTTGFSHVDMETTASQPFLRHQGKYIDTLEIVLLF